MKTKTNSKTMAKDTEIKYKTALGGRRIDRRIITLYNAIIFKNLAMTDAEVTSDGTTAAITFADPHHIFCLYRMFFSDPKYIDPSLELYDQMLSNQNEAGDWYIRPRFNFERNNGLGNWYQMTLYIPMRQQDEVVKRLEQFNSHPEIPEAEE